MNNTTYLKTALNADLLSSATKMHVTSKATVGLHARKATEEIRLESEMPLSNQVLNTNNSETALAV